MTLWIVFYFLNNKRTVFSSTNYRIIYKIMMQQYVCFEHQRINSLFNKPYHQPAQQQPWKKCLKKYIFSRTKFGSLDHYLHLSAKKNYGNIKLTFTASTTTTADKKNARKVHLFNNHHQKASWNTHKMTFYEGHIKCTVENYRIVNCNIALLTYFLCLIFLWAIVQVAPWKPATKKRVMKVMRKK